MDMNRQDLLNSLITLNLPIQELEEKIKYIGWDVEEPLVFLERRHIESVLNRHLSGELTLDDIFRWAELIECREDINYTGVHRKYVQNAIFKLANPGLQKESDEGIIKSILNDFITD
jgi:hypothetical protein